MQDGKLSIKKSNTEKKYSWFCLRFFYKKEKGNKMRKEQVSNEFFCKTIEIIRKKITKKITLADTHRDPSSSYNGLFVCFFYECKSRFFEIEILSMNFTDRSCTENI